MILFYLKERKNNLRSNPLPAPPVNHVYSKSNL